MSGHHHKSTGDIPFLRRFETRSTTSNICNEIFSILCNSGTTWWRKTARLTDPPWAIPQTDPATLVVRNGRKSRNRGLILSRSIQHDFKCVQRRYEENKAWKEIAEMEALSQLCNLHDRPRLHDTNYKKTQDLLVLLVLVFSE